MFDIGMVIKGAGAGIAYSLAMFSKKKEQEFDWKKFGSTALVGAGAGIVMAIADMDIGIAYEMLIAAGATGIVESLFKAIYRRIWPDKYSTPF